MSLTTHPSTRRRIRAHRRHVLARLEASLAPDWVRSPSLGERIRGAR